MNIFIRPTAGGEAKRLTSEKDRDIRTYAWKGNKFVVYAMDDKGDENFHREIPQAGGVNLLLQRRSVTADAPETASFVNALGGHRPPLAAGLRSTARWGGNSFSVSPVSTPWRSRLWRTL